MGFFKINIWVSWALLIFLIIALGLFLAYSIYFQRSRDFAKDNQDITNPPITEATGAFLFYIALLQAFICLCFIVYLIFDIVLINRRSIKKGAINRAYNTAIGMYCDELDDPAEKNICKFNKKAIASGNPEQCSALQNAGNIKGAEQCFINSGQINRIDPNNINYLNVINQNEMLRRQQNANQFRQRQQSLNSRVPPPYNYNPGMTQTGSFNPQVFGPQGYSGASVI